MIELEKNYLYHYTSFESAVKIISSGVLRFSKIDKLNDIHEVNGPLVMWSKEEDGRKIQKNLQYYSQISLTTDGERKGYDIPAMWGHYAERGHGVCLAFDMEVLTHLVKKRRLYSKEVDYGEIEDPGEYVYDGKIHGSAKEFILISKDTLFFRKSTDWKYEQEYRIITIDSKYTPLQFKEALVGAILYNEKHAAFCSSAEYKTLKALLPSGSVYRYGTSFEKGRLFSEVGKRLEKEMEYDFSSALDIKF